MSLTTTLERTLSIADRGRPTMRMPTLVALSLALVIGLVVDGAAETTTVLYTAALGTSELSVVTFTGSVVNLVSTPVTATVRFCTLGGGCDTGDDCVNVTLAAQQGCVASFNETAGIRYARIELASPAKNIIAKGLLSARIGVDILATVPAH